MEQSPSVLQLPELTDEQEEVAALTLEICNLQKYADRTMTWVDSQGRTFEATVAYGLGYCSERIKDWEPERIERFVIALFAQDDSSPES